MKYEMTRKDRQTTREEALQIVDACQYATLATIDEDATPYCVPISIVRSGEKVYIHGLGKGHKMDNIRRNAKVCLSGVSENELCPAKYTTDFSSFVLFGKAEIIESEAEKTEAMKLMVEKYAPDFMHRFEGVMTKMMKATCVVKIDIEEITGKKKAECCEAK